MIDFSHANSSKDYKRQMNVANDIAGQMASGEKRIVGGEGVKVFSVAWDARLGIISAGEDRRVQVNAPSGTGHGA